MLVVAADDGVMPQTREHLAILELLGISERGLAITKRDRVDAETAELVRLEVAELLADGPAAEAAVVEVSARPAKGWMHFGGARGGGLECRRPRAGGIGAASRRPLVHAAGNRHGRHRHSVVGHDRRQRPPRPGAGGSAGSGTQGPGARPAGGARRCRAARRRLAGRCRTVAGTTRPDAGEPGHPDAVLRGGCGSRPRRCAADAVDGARRHRRVPASRHRRRRRDPARRKRSCQLGCESGPWPWPATTWMRFRLARTAADDRRGTVIDPARPRRPRSRALAKAEATAPSAPAGPPPGADELARGLAAAPLPPRPGGRRASQRAAYLVASGRAVRGGGLAFHLAGIRRCHRGRRSARDQTESVSLASLRGGLGVSREYAQALLEGPPGITRTSATSGGCGGAAASGQRGCDVVGRSGREGRE